MLKILATFLLLLVPLQKSFAAFIVEPIWEARPAGFSQSGPTGGADTKFDSDGFGSGYGLRLEFRGVAPGTFGFDFRMGEVDYDFTGPSGPSFKSSMSYYRTMFYAKYDKIRFLPLWAGANLAHRYKDKGRNIRLAGNAGFYAGVGLRFGHVQLNMEFSYYEFDVTRGAGDPDRQFYGSDLTFSLSFPFTLFNGKTK